MKKILVIFALCVLPFTGVAWDNADSIMYWQLGDAGNIVDDGPNDVYTFLGFDHANDEIGVRIAAYDKDGNLVKYLNPVYPDSPEVPGGIDWEYNDEWIGTRDDLPARNRQAYYGPDDYLEMLFQMQVGNYDEDFNFNPMLWTKGELVDGKHWYDTGSILPPGTEWTPTAFYTINPVSPVPEPSSSLLLLLGISILMLKRPIKITMTKES